MLVRFTFFKLTLILFQFGCLILWDFNETISGTSTSHVKQWNLNETLKEPSKEEVVLMKACCNENEIWFSVVCAR